MIADALRVLFDEAKRAAGSANQATILEPPGLPGSFLLVTADGKVEARDKMAPKRSHLLGSLTEVKEFVEFATEKLQASPSVWYSESGVVIVLNDTAHALRQDQAVVKFEPTQSHDLLRGIADHWYPQKDFVRLLRVALADAATDSTRRLLAVSRVLGFSNSVAGHGKVELGRQSLGRDIEDQVTSEVGDLPEEVTFNVRLFTDSSLTRRFSIPCAVDVDARNATFNLAPLAEAFDDAVADQLALIGQELEGELTCPVFRGRP